MKISLIGRWILIIPTLPVSSLALTDTMVSQAVSDKGKLRKFINIFIILHISVLESVLPPVVRLGVLNDSIFFSYGKDVDLTHCSGISGLSMEIIEILKEVVKQLHGYLLCFG